MAEDEIDNPDPAGFAGANRDAIYRMITGADPNDLAEQVRILGGTRAAAEIAGVNIRTVQRWITKTGTQRIRNPGAGSQLVGAAAAEARATPEARQRIADTRRTTLMRTQGVKMTGTGKGGPVNATGSKAYVKTRRWNHHVGADVMGASIDAYLEGGEEAAFTEFNAKFGDEYGSDGAMFDEWLFTDMNSLDFNPDTGGGS